MRWLTRHVARGALAAARALMGLAALAQRRDTHRPRLVAGAGGGYAPCGSWTPARAKRRTSAKLPPPPKKRVATHTEECTRTFSPLSCLSSLPSWLLGSCRARVSLPLSSLGNSGVSNAASRSCCVVSARVVLTLVIVCGVHRGRSSIARVCRARVRVLPERAQRRSSSLAGRVQRAWFAGHRGASRFFRLCATSHTRVGVVRSPSYLSLSGCVGRPVGACLGVSGGGLTSTPVT